MTNADIVAWYAPAVATYAAIVASAVLAWDVIKWKSTGARIRISVSKNMVLVGGGVRDTSKYILLTATNYGTQPTTITHMHMEWHPSLRARLQGKKRRHFVVASPNKTGQPIPYVLAAGTEWMGMTKQDSNVEELSRTGRLLIGINHSVAKKGLSRRVIIR
jgi:hypothetical protein